MMKRKKTGLDTFLSLGWYEVALRFLFTFVAKTSEVLLAAGLVVSTANFLTDGSILATHPGISIAWAWAQALAIDSSLGVSLSYAFEYIKQDEWIRGALYGLLTLLLALVAGAITTIDIVSHALHLSTSDAMVQMGINIAVLSRLRAIAVIGFILMSRLRDLPLTALLMKTEPEPQPSLAPISGRPQEPRVQTMIQSLCSQFSAEEMAQILNACIAAKKLMFAQISPKEVPEPHQPQVDQQRQGYSSEHASEPSGTGAVQGEPESLAVPSLQSEPAPVSSIESARKVPMATEPSVPEEHHFWRDPGPSSQVLHVPEPIAGVPSKEPVLEQAYQSLVAEGKKPSGRALAERTHIHRSTCVKWLRMKQQMASENEGILEEPQRDDLSVSDEPLDAAVMELPGKALAHESASVPPLPPDTAMMELSEMEMERNRAADDVSPDVFPDSSLPEDTLDV